MLCLSTWAPGTAEKVPVKDVLLQYPRRTTSPVSKHAAGHQVHSETTNRAPRCANVTTASKPHRCNETTTGAYTGFGDPPVYRRYVQGFLVLTPTLPTSKWKHMLGRCPAPQHMELVASKHAQLCARVPCRQAHNTTVLFVLPSLRSLMLQPQKPTPLTCSSCSRRRCRLQSPVARPALSWVPASSSMLCRFGRRG